ncbi:hypothetical protein ACFQVC_07545 [Streptomyces monticola]|uniref:LytR family transcriptional regulator n=1 Tax=Streptomyces monticola TaxID=2666263 RepID=A0ABW2JEC7_9ACTN
MNPDPLQAPATGGHPVTVLVSNCGPHDARTVLGRLASVFPERAAADQVAVPAEDSPAPGASERPTVWTADLDAGASAEPPASGAPPQAAKEGIEGTVDVSVQGAPQDVATVRAALADAFSVRDSRAAAGDQEQDVELRLGPH